MKKSQLLGAVCAGIIILLASGQANATTVYNLDRIIGAGTVTGFIETDGTIGVLSSANITNWVLTLTAPNLGGGSPDVIAADIGSITALQGKALTASASVLTFDFDAVGSNYLFLLGTSQDNWWAIDTTGCSSSSSSGEECIAEDATTGDVTEAANRSGTIDFAVATVPVPAAVWLFGSGLLGLIGVARRKKA